jgi:amino acid adenylation domain-containing protein
MNREMTSGAHTAIEAAPAQRPREVPRRTPLELKCVHRWIEVQAVRNPEAIAVAVAGSGESLSYAELNARANRLARRLRGLGVGPEVLVGVCLDRSPGLVVGLLAVLKAGGAYVPLDPTYPAERLAFMLEDAHVAALLTRSSLLDRLPAGRAAVVCLDREWDEIAAESAEDLPGGAKLDNLAYVIYTSGSTGKPKGAMIHHRGLANYVAWAARTYGVSQGQGAPVHSSISFDLTITALFVPLVAGRRVDLLEEDLGIEQLSAALRRTSGYSLVKLTPAHLRWLGDQLEPSEAAGKTRAFIIGGEPLRPEHIAFWREWAPETVLVNEYGPTETVVGCCVYRVSREDAIAGPIPIGQPIAQTQLHVLDQRLRVVPVGVAGELYIGGAGLARGYLGRPGLTAERFLPDPFGDQPGGRLYRTGDLARWRSDGNLEYLGRADRQVKIRGYRVEPGEVEEALARHPAVRETTVLAREESLDDHRLVAYLTLHADGPAPSTSDLHQFLRDVLPEPMIPSRFVVLDAFPLTPNGKIDREALPALEGAEPGAEALPVGPCGPIEEALSEIWVELLGGPRPGPRDNFFERGGHSLMATQLLARVRHTFDVEVPLKDFLDEPTLVGLARLVARGLVDGGAPPAPPIVPIGRDRPLPASFAQQRLWYLDQVQPGQPAYNMPIAVHLQGPLDVSALQHALAEIVRRHEVLRTTLVAGGGIPRQVIAESLEVPLPVEDLSGLDPEPRQARAQELLRGEATRPFDLARGPLIRAGLLRLEEQEHIAVVVLHHVIADGWSLGVLIREVSALYQAFHAGEGSPLPPPAIQYADYAAWQRAWLQGEVLQAEVDHWSARLAGLPDLELPADRPAPAAQSGRGGRRTATLEPALLEGVRALGRQEGATLYMTLLAAFQVLLYRYSGQEDLAVGTPIAGRTRPELEGLIGCFVNTLVLRSDLAGAPTFRALVGRVRRVAIEAYGHQELPFEKLVEALQPERGARWTPLFRAMFTVQNAPLPALQSPEMVLTPLEVFSETSKFDLDLSATESPERLELTMEYNVDLFDPATVDRMLMHYRLLLEGIVADPDQRIGAIPMLSQEERSRMQASWGDSGFDEFAAGLDEGVDGDLDVVWDGQRPEEVEPR